VSTGQLLNVRGLDGDTNPAHNNYVLRTVGAVPMWLPPGVESIVQGANIHVDATDPLHPIVSASSVSYLALTTTVNGVPDEVWDDNDEQVLQEVSL